MTKPRKKAAKAAKVTGGAAKRRTKRKLRKPGPTNQVRELTAANEWLHNELRVLAAQRDQIDKMRQLVATRVESRRVDGV